MKRVLLLSDTHDFLDDLILQYATEADEIWHAGDIGTVQVINTLQAIKPFRGVYGNIDGRDVRNVCPLDLRFECEGIDVLMTHIGGYPGHYEPRIRNIIRSNPPKLFICGHSHILKVMRDQTTGTLCMNPGASGVHGFHKLRTVIRFQASNGQILQPEVIELGPRGRITK